MSIQERLASVSNLQNSVLQRYLEYLFLGREWKTALHREIEAGAQGQYSTKFSGACLPCEWQHDQCRAGLQKYSRFHNHTY